MNSQVYCLPQTFGWNAIQGFSEERADKKESEQSLKGKNPYFILKFNGPDPSSDIRKEVMRRKPYLRFPIEDAELIVRDFVWSTESRWKFSPHGLPSSYKPLPPVTYETRADPPAIRREYYRPMEGLKAPKGLASDDPERGLYEWRELASRPGFGIWQPLRKIPVLSNAGERSTLLPHRLKRHDPDYEKERWDNVMHLSRQNSLSYGYCKKTPGFAGHKQTVEHIMSDVESRAQNQTFSATQDLLVKCPREAYLESTERIRHRDSGVISRLVTLANPNNPFTDDVRLVGPPPYKKWAT